MGEAERTKLTEHVSFLLVHVALWPGWPWIGHRIFQGPGCVGYIIFRQKRRETLRVSFDLFLENHAGRLWPLDVRWIWIRSWLQDGLGQWCKSAREAQSKATLNNVAGIMVSNWIFLIRTLRLSNSAGGGPWAVESVQVECLSPTRDNPPSGTRDFFYVLFTPSDVWDC